MPERHVENELLEALLEIRGTVQAVGFRPFVYRMAKEFGITGWVRNGPEGVSVSAVGTQASLNAFERSLMEQLPHAASISSIRHLRTPTSVATAPENFRILDSEQAGKRSAALPPDLALCPDCTAEILDPMDRRYRYPFTNCTACGPRYTIIEALPYDRANTTMRGFAMCTECLEEYSNPSNRRFHAEPNACPNCGPALDLWDRTGRSIYSGEDRIKRVAALLSEGAVVALKGLGGFHLLVDAANDTAVKELRSRKLRLEKPFAVMFPTLDDVSTYCLVSAEEGAALSSDAAPIVLLEKRSDFSFSKMSPAVAPQNPSLGAMLPYTPLHLLLLREFDRPVVATSGNLSDEPICTDEREAVDRLGLIADYFLVHNRPIARHVDDSVVRIFAGEPIVLRRARGFAPAPISIGPLNKTALAVGGHLKNTVAVTVGSEAILSAHIGDLDSTQALEAFKRTTQSLLQLYEVTPEVVVCDLHPDYASTHFAETLNLPIHRVQHHHAHILACMAEHSLTPPVLGVAWDGTGYGLDKTIWGGEFLAVHQNGFERFAHILPFVLPGGEAAVRDPRRTALSLLFSAGVTEDRDSVSTRLGFGDAEYLNLLTIIRTQLLSPLTSSVGRLFDGVSALLGLCQTTSFEGQAAMALEYVLSGKPSAESYKLLWIDGNPSQLDWRDMVRSIWRDLEQGVSGSIISYRFHNALVEALSVAVQKSGFNVVALSGGCFQNRYLLESAIRRLTDAGTRAYFPQRIPTNDNGISLGQLTSLSSLQLSGSGDGQR